MFNSDYFVPHCNKRISGTILNNFILYSTALSMFLFELFDDNEIFLCSLVCSSSKGIIIMILYMHFFLSKLHQDG